MERFASARSSEELAGAIAPCARAAAAAWLWRPPRLCPPSATSSAIPCCFGCAGSGFEGWLTNPVAGSEGSGPGSRQPSPSRTAMAAGGPFAAVTGFAPPGAAGSGGGTLNPLYDRAQSGSFAGAATPAGVSDLLARLVELQRQQSEFAQAQVG